MDEDDGLFGDDEEEVVTSRGTGGAEDEGLFGSDEDEEANSSKPSPAPENLGDKADMDDLFGDEGGGAALPVKARPVAKRSTSKLRITKTEMLPETTRALFVRMPNVLKIQPAPFEPATYDIDQEREQLGKMATGVRWRYKRDDDGNVILGPDGKPEMESNARLVKLKTAFQLIVGNNVYDCQNQELGNSFLYMQKASIVEDERRTALELVGPIDTRMSLQPQNVHDLSRIMIGKVLKEEHKKVKRIETVKMQDDVMKTRPEDRMEQLQKGEDDKIRQLKKQKGDGGGYQQARIRMSADYLNADAEYDTMNLSDIKQRSTRSKKSSRKNRDESEEDSDDDDDDEGDDLDGFIIKGDDDDDEDEDDGPRYFRKDGKKKPVKRAKKADLEEPEVDDEEEEEDEDEDEEDEDEEVDLDDDEEDKPESKKETRTKKPATTSIASSASVQRDAPETNDIDGDASADPAPRRKKMVIDDDDE